MKKTGYFVQNQGETISQALLVYSGEKSLWDSAKSAEKDRQEGLDYRIVKITVEASDEFVRADKNNENNW